jgi:hypothetical protein
MNHQPSLQKLVLEMKKGQAVKNQRERESDRRDGERGIYGNGVKIPRDVGASRYTGISVARFLRYTSVEEDT